MSGVCTTNRPFPGDDVVRGVLTHNDRRHTMPPLWVLKDGFDRTRTTEITGTHNSQTSTMCTSHGRRSSHSSGARRSNRRASTSSTASSDYSSHSSSGVRRNSSWRSKLFGVLVWLMILGPDFHLLLVPPHLRSSTGSEIGCIMGAAGAMTSEPGLAADWEVGSWDEEDEEDEAWGSSPISRGLFPATGSQFAAPGGSTTANKAFTYRVLSEAWADGFNGVNAHTARESCPFAQEPDSTQSSAFWDRALSDAMILSLSLGDEKSLSARNMYDVIDGIGSILTCCPGLLLDPADTADSVASDSDGGGSSRRSIPPLPSCGLLGASVDGPTAADGDSNRPGDVGYELTVRFSSALRAARLPSVALEALHGAAGVVKNKRQGAAWAREMALVLLQMGRVGEATVMLYSALERNFTNLRVLQTLGAALVAQGAVAEGVWGSACGFQGRGVTTVRGAGAALACNLIRGLKQQFGSNWRQRFDGSIQLVM